MLTGETLSPLSRMYEDVRVLHLGYLRSRRRAKLTLAAHEFHPVQ